MRTNCISEELKPNLRNNISSYIKLWLPGGRIEGAEYIALNPTRHDKNLGSFRINLITGKWIDFATGYKGGDLISLYAYINGISQHQALSGLMNNNIYSHVNDTIPPKVPKLPNLDKYELITKLWEESVDADYTPVENYLRNRGYIGKLPSSIKCNPNLYHKPTDSYHPAMIAAVSKWPNNDIIGIHRTYLNKKGEYKANISPNKMMIGITKGGAVQLAPAGKTLILAEGIETALSIYLATSIPTWACLSTSGLINIELPGLEITDEVIIAADNDNAGKKAANKLAIGLIKDGYQVRIIRPPEINCDFNDLLRRDN